MIFERLNAGFELRALTAERAAGEKNFSRTCIVGIGPGAAGRIGIARVVDEREVLRKRRIQSAAAIGVTFVRRERDAAPGAGGL
jgi:hypothetical protein